MLDFFQHLSSNTELLSCSKLCVWKSSSDHGFWKTCHNPERAELKTAWQHKSLPFSKLKCMICNLNTLMQFIVCHSLFILLKAKRKTILSAGSLHGTSSWPESLLFSAATAPLAAAGSTSRLWNWGRRVICASWGFSFFVRRDVSVQWGHAVCLGVGPWLGCGRQGLRDAMLCWRLLACCLCYPKPSKQKTATSGVLRTLEEGTKLTLLTSFLSLYLYFIDVCWENMRQLVEGILILYWDIN